MEETAVTKKQSSNQISRHLQMSMQQNSNQITALSNELHAVKDMIHNNQLDTHKSIGSLATSVEVMKAIMEDERQDRKQHHEDHIKLDKKIDTIAVKLDTVKDNVTNITHDLDTIHNDDLPNRMGKVEHGMMYRKVLYGVIVAIVIAILTIVELLGGIRALMSEDPDVRASAKTQISESLDTLGQHMQTLETREFIRQNTTD